jgi:hypothetical protein
LTFHNDSARTGQNGQETTLTLSNVHSTTFGKLFTVSVDGQVYAQPLVQSGVTITTGPYQGTHNVVFVATEHDSLYAIDGGNGQVLWWDSFLTGIPGATVTPVPAGDLEYVDPKDIDPEIGITGTPVIDPSTNTLYLITKTKEVVGQATPHYVQRLHAVSTADGSEKFGGPVVIADTSFDGTNFTFNSGPAVNGTGDGSVGGSVPFNAARQHQRAALTLANGTVYAAWASHQDFGPHHGWVLGFSAANLQLTAAFNDTPNGGDGGIWQSGGGLVVDPQGYLYAETGNGTFDTTLDAQGMPVNQDYGDSFIKLAVDPDSSQTNQNGNGWGLKVVDYFTPHNQQDLQDQDLDLGAGGPVILPDSVGNSTHPHLLAGAGKEGTIYLIDRDNMGHFDPNTNHVVQELGQAVGGPAYDTPAYFHNALYYVGAGDNGEGTTSDYAQAFSIADGSAHLSTTATSQSTDSYFFPGSTPGISANGTSNGIVWDVEHGSNELRAYDASNYATELYTSDQAGGGRDALGSSIKFTVPTVANGRVYVGTANALVIFGLFAGAVPAAPSALHASLTGATSVSLAWTRNSTNETGLEVERATDPNFTQNVTLVGTTGPGVTQFTDSGLSSLATYYYRVRATGANGDSANSNILRVTTLPAGWSAQDVGGPGQFGSTAFDGTTWTVQGGGSDIWSAPDQFQYAYQSVSGDASIVAHVTSVQDTNYWAKAGVMFRDGTAAGAPYVAVLQNPNDQVEMQWRDTAGADSSWNGSQVGDTVNVKWLELVRSGDTFSAYYASTTGTPADADWVLIGSHTLAMSSATAGLAVTAGDNSALCAATFTNVSFTTNSSNSGSLPSGWSAGDVGSPGQAGSTSFDGTTWTVSGGGSDIWSNPDQFQYAYQSVSGDVTLVARVTSVQDTSYWAKAGVMFRDGTGSDAPYVAVFENPNGQVEMQWRDSAGGASDWNGSQVGDATNVKWVKLVRSGNTFSAYYASTTGTPTSSDWVLIGTHALAMSSATAGLAVTADDNTTLCAATFTNVSITPGGM